MHSMHLNYLVVVDRYSNWPIIEQAQEGSNSLVNCLQHTFTTFGKPDECASDRGLVCSNLSQPGDNTILNTSVL